MPSVTSKRSRLLGVVAVLLATQMLTACVVVPVHGYRRAVVVEPGPHYGPPPPHYRHY